MKKRKNIMLWSILFLILSSSISFPLSAQIVRPFHSSNQVFYVGSASIWGNGTSSILEANVENNLLIRIDETSEVIDLYIDYTINCEGLTDEGVVTLTLYKDNQNISFNVSQSPTSKSGSLYLHDIEVNRGDSFFVTIAVGYGNVLPLYHNQTSDTNAAVVPKSMLFSKLFILGDMMFWSVLLRYIDEFKEILWQ